MSLDRSPTRLRDSDITLQTLTAADASEFRDLRLRALRENPTAFRATHDHESQLSLEAIAARLTATNCFVLGARYSDKWVGTAGFNREVGAKSQHKGLLWGLYVAPELRGRGVGRQLLREVLARVDAIPGLLRLNLAVSANNASAVALYEAAGFAVYGREPQALQVDGVLYDQWLMSRPTGQRQPSANPP
jgi:RimJ/RimL family protein N-acetyltransferase